MDLLESRLRGVGVHTLETIIEARGGGQQGKTRDGAIVNQSTSENLLKTCTGCLGKAVGGSI